MIKKYFKSGVLFLICFTFIFNAYFQYRIKQQSKIIASGNNSYFRNIYLPDRSDGFKPKFIPNYTATCKIPILMYHSIGYEKGNVLRVPKDKFYLEMKYLKENGFTSLSFDQLYNILSGTEKPPKKPILISFDDGYQDNYKNAYPILKELGLKATIFVITDCIDKNNSYITSKQIREMIKNGIDVESHTEKHYDLSNLSYNVQFQTLKKSREKLEYIEEKKIKYLSYPVGKYNKYTEKAAKDAGYIMAVTTKPGFASKNNGFFFLHRVRIINSQSLNGFKSMLKY